MPHRPERPAGAAAAAAAAAAVYSPHVAAANTIRGNVGVRGPILRPAAQPALQHSNVYNAAGVVSPIVNSMVPTHPSSQPVPWIGSKTHGVNRIMPSLQTPKSSDSADRSTHKQQDEESTVATLATEATADDAREATASALLLVSSQNVQRDNSGASTTISAANTKEEGEESTPEADGGEQANGPLKKRKKHLDFLRRNQETGESTADDPPQPFHVSPVSNSSLGSSHVEARTLSNEEITPGRTPHAAPSNTTQRTNSYDSKGSPFTQCKQTSTQALPDSAKIHDTTDIAPPAHVVVPHFPTVLHRVLSDKEYAGTVLEWLPNGEAWKVLRWDALRRQVLPVYFSELRDEDGKGCGTIDAFLWHLTAWGFEEIKDGTDVGAYRHDLFIRGAQKLCSKMRFTAVPADDEQPTKKPKTVSPGRVSSGEVGDRSLLQVPSLASTSRSDGEGNSIKCNPNKRARYDDQASNGEVPANSLHRQSSPCPPGWQSSMVVNYRGDETPYTPTNSWGQYYSESSHHGMRQMGQFTHTGYDSRYHFRHHGAESVMRQPSQYTPPRVRSGRGSMRISTANRSAAATPPTTPAAVRSSFPVSNRGKGTRRPSACRTAVPGADFSPASAAHDRTSPEQANSSPSQPVLNSAHQSVAIAISRKTKRKSPNSGNGSPNSNPETTIA